MTLQDLRDVLSASLNAGYKMRETIPGGIAYSDCRTSLEGNIQLLVLLDEGVRRTMEKRSTEVAAMAESANERRSVHDFSPIYGNTTSHSNLCKACNLTFVKGNHYEADF